MNKYISAICLAFTCFVSSGTNAAEPFDQHIMKVSEITAVAINWHVGDDHVLTLLVSSDGTINRMGDGRPVNTDRDLYIGRTPISVLPHITSLLDDEMLKHTGKYELAPIQGTACTLQILLWAGNQRDGFEFRYGSESGGLPREIPKFVTNAIYSTQQWYEHQQTQAGKRP